MIYNVGSGSASNLVHLHISYDPSMAGANITAVNGVETHTAVANASGLTVINGTKLGDWTVSEDMYDTSAVISTTFYGNYNTGLGGGVYITVEFEEAFVGKTLTLTNGSKTYTREATGESVLFVVADYGTWTVSAEVEGEIYDSSVEVTEDGEYSMELITMPDGSTVIPTDNIHTWLKCAGINKNYTTIAEVLADTSTLSALIADENAVNYMARSTTWTSSVCGNSNAMTTIGLNNNCANTLLDNDTWANAICNSAYFEKVLNVKVPTLSSRPSQLLYYGIHEPYYGFDGYTDDYHMALTQHGTNDYIGYHFNNKIQFRKAMIYNSYTCNSTNVIQISDNKFSSVKQTLLNATKFSNSQIYYNLPKNDGANDIRVLLNYWDSTGSIGWREVQFYGREV